MILKPSHHRSHIYSCTLSSLTVPCRNAIQSFTIKVVCLRATTLSLIGTKLTSLLLSPAPFFLINLHGRTMACATLQGTIVPAPLEGTPSVMNFALMGKLCIMHANGPLGWCMFTEYKEGCCCGGANQKIGFEVPILGYNTTPSVYMTCEGGLVPEINPPPTYTGPYTGPSPQPHPITGYPSKWDFPTPRFTPTGGSLTLTFTPTNNVPTPSRTSNASKRKIGRMLLMTLFAAMVL